MPHEVTVFIALGSNEGDRHGALHDAVRRLAGCVRVDRLSHVYETEPAYVTDQPQFLNMVVAAATSLAPRALLDCLKRIEARMGRAGGMRWGPRPIDLDILLYGDDQVDEPDLRIPHPRLAERPFVLEPLADLAPDVIPPGASKSIRRLADEARTVGAIIARLGPLDAPPGGAADV